MIFPLTAPLLAVLPSSCSCYFYVIDVNCPIRFRSISLSAKTQEYTLEMLSHIPELSEVKHKGTFQQILLLPDKAVFFFSFERDQMKPASKATRDDFLCPFKSEIEVFPQVGLDYIDISIHISVFRVAQPEATSILDTTIADSRNVCDKLATLSSNISCPEELVKEMKALAHNTVENVTKLKGKLCEMVAIPEILITSCLAEELKKYLDSSFIVSCEGGGSSGGQRLFSPAATSKEDLRIYNEKFIWNGRIQGASIILKDFDYDKDEDEDNLLAGCAFEVKLSVGNFERVRPQLVRNMERVATDLAFMAVTDKVEIFSEIVIYGGIIEVSESRVQPSILTMDFVKGTTCFRYQNKTLTIKDFFNSVIHLLQPK